MDDYRPGGGRDNLTFSAICAGHSPFQFVYLFAFVCAPLVKPQANSLFPCFPLSRCKKQNIPFFPTKSLNPLLVFFCLRSSCCAATPQRLGFQAFSRSSFLQPPCAETWCFKTVQLCVCVRVLDAGENDRSVGSIVWRNENWKRGE